MTKQIDDQLKRIVTIAGAIVISVPERKAQYSKSAYVSWSLIEQLKDALIDAGYSPDKARRMLNELRNNENKPMGPNL